MRKAAVRKKAVTLAPAPRLLQRRHVGGGRGDNGLAPPVVHEALRGPGRPLDAGVRSFFEPRFGRDFSGVRVHTDDAAARSADAVSARAYAVGRDVVFAKGQYDPHSAEGRHLLAHELSHTIQQAGVTAPTSSLRIGAASSAAEQESSAAADAATRGENVEPAQAQADAGTVQRDSYKDDGTGLRGHPIRKTPGEKLADELQALVNTAVWKEIRKEVYPKESAAGIERSKKRRAGTEPDLTGLGKVAALDHFAGAIRKLQKDWAALATADARVKGVGDAANAELTAASVPEFLIVRKAPMEFKGSFTPILWRYTVSEDLVKSGTLGDDDAAELANTTMHESRHAEQQFLAARFAAGQAAHPTPGAIAAQVTIPEAIATKAIAAKFDSATDKKVADLGKRMFTAGVTEGAKNQQISQDDGIAEMNAMRPQAQKAVDDLRASESAANMDKARKMKEALSKQIDVVKRRYTLYRNIPYEADAHEVGDAEEIAFKATPP
jgi:hypothetical protein